MKRKKSGISFAILKRLSTVSGMLACYTNSRRVVSQIIFSTGLRTYNPIAKILIVVIFERHLVYLRKMLQA